MTISKEQALSAVSQLRNLVPSIAAGAQAQEACNTLRAYIYQEVAREAVPDGWKLVPVELTPEMWDAGTSAYQSLTSVYHAMLAAAPQPAEQHKPTPLHGPHGSIAFTADGEAADKIRADIAEQNRRNRAGTAQMQRMFAGGRQPALDVAGLVEALELLLEVEDDQCRYDHDGNCQTHNLDHIDDGCRVEKARTALTAYREQGGAA